MAFAFVTGRYRWRRPKSRRLVACGGGHASAFAKAMADRSHTRPTHGFSLIELLIAVVVLMIGIYGMLRVFPSGYTAVEATQQQTTAAQLGDSELARWKLDPESLPDAILATDYSGKLIRATLTNSVDTLSGKQTDRIPPYLTYSTKAAVVPDTTDYRPKVVSERELALLDQNARPFLYTPTDITPSVFDTVQRAPLDQGGPYSIATHPNWEPNSLYLPRTVVGERIDIRSLPQMMVGATAQQSRIGVPFYLLSHAPCDALRLERNPKALLQVPPPPPIPVYFDVYDARLWRYRQADAYSLQPREFWLDGNQLMVNPVAQQRIFRVDYTDLKTRERVIGATVTVNRRQPSGAIPDLGVGQQAAPDPGTVQVYERMIPLTEDQYQAMLANNLFSEDVWPRNAYYVNAASTVSGQIQFSPSVQADPKPTDITIAKVDYRVFDWQILVFDIEVPSVPMDSAVLRKPIADLGPAERAQLGALAKAYVQLPVRKLKSLGYSNPPRQPRPQEIARGVREFYDANGVLQAVDPKDKRSWAYVIAVDRQSGRILTDNELSETAGWPVNPWMRRSRFNVDYKEGLLYFNYNPTTVYGYNPDVDTPSRSGRTYRIFCLAQNDWAVQLMIASRLYARSDNGKPWGNPVAAGGAGNLSMLTYAWVRDKDRKQLYFPLSESGQTVAVDYYRTETDALTNTQRQILVSGEVHTIGPPNVNALGEWVSTLSEPLKYAPNEWGPTAVRGLSVRARTTWVTRGRSASFQQFVRQAASSGEINRPLTGVTPDLQEIWHQVIISTYLTRAPI